MAIAGGRGFGRDWDYDGAEILADGIVHALGLVLAVVGSITLLSLTATARTASDLAPHLVYCISLLVTLGVSAAYNLWPVSPVKWTLRRFDHAMIFSLIAGTYTPFLARIDSVQTALVLAGIWTASVAGMVLKLLDIGQREWLGTTMYLALGWSGVATLGPVIASVPGISMLLLLAGGLLYSGGAVFHHWRSLRFQNAIWHGFVLCGAACHFAAVVLALDGA